MREGMEGMEGMEAVAHNPPALKTRRGFNLIEAAIVLAVVGGVVGGIWTAAATMIENWKVNKTVEGILTTVKNTQNLISFQDAETIGQQVITHQLYSAGVFPKDWVNNTLQMQTPMKSQIRTVNDVNGPPPKILIYVYDMNVSACTKLVSKISSVGGKDLDCDNSGLNRAPCLHNGHNMYAYPISLEQAQAICTENSEIRFFFKYTRTN